MNRSGLIAWLLGLWAVLWTFNYASQANSVKEFEWPTFSLGNPIAAVLTAAFYSPPLVAVMLLIPVQSNGESSLVSVHLARGLVALLVLFVGFMAFLNLALQ